MAQRANLELRKDITERKRMEDERQVFVSLLDNSSDFIGVADPSGKPLYLNPAGRNMVGLAKDLPSNRLRSPTTTRPTSGHSLPTWSSRICSSVAGGRVRRAFGTGKRAKRFQSRTSTS